MKKKLLATSVALSVLLAPGLMGGAMAQVPVIDSGVIAATNKIAANTAEQLKRLNDIKKTTEDILKSLGQNGQGQYDLNKNESWKEFAGGGDLLKALTQFAPNTCAATNSCGQSGQGGEDFQDLQAARDYVLKTLYSSKMTSANEDRDYKQIRENVMRDANVTAYALALVAREYLADAASRAEKLDGIVNGADDVRADLKANSAVTLAQHQQLTGMLAVLTSMLERDAAAYFRTEEREVYNPNGGSSAPDVYRDKDHLPDGTRVGVDGSGAKQSSTMGGSNGGLETGGLNGGSGGNGEKAWNQADSTYGSDNVSKSLGAASIASGMDGNEAASSALDAAAKASNSGDLAGGLYNGASTIGKASGNEQLKWMFDSADYGMNSGNWDDAVDVASGKKPMIDVMFDVARDMSGATGTNRQILREAEKALENGTIDQKQAALIALQVASDAAGHSELTGLLKGAGKAVKGYDMQSIVTGVIKDTAGRGSAVSEVVNIITKTTW